MKRCDKYGNEILDRPSPPGDGSQFPSLVSFALEFCRDDGGGGGAPIGDLERRFRRSPFSEERHRS